MEAMSIAVEWDADPQLKQTNNQLYLEKKSSKPALNIEDNVSSYLI